MTKVLIIGYGNPGRLDDGLGPAFVKAVKQYNIKGVNTDSDYQLTVEDAVDIAEHDIVIFADADVRGPEPFYLKKIEPAAVVSLSSHSIKPNSLIGLVKESFYKEVEAYVLGIRGYEFNEFEEKLSGRAVKNLNKAIEFIKPLLENGSFYEIRAKNVTW